MGSHTIHGTVSASFNYRSHGRVRRMRGLQGIICDRAGQGTMAFVTLFAMALGWLYHGNDGRWDWL